LVAPRASYPADAVRRATVIEKYRKGEQTGASRSDEERGDVRSAIK
jgi:type IV pilus biogenesis protein CpaD/CtpE